MHPIRRQLATRLMPLHLIRCRAAKLVALAFYILASASFGFAHRPEPVPVDLAQFVLPDGTIPPICGGNGSQEEATTKADAGIGCSAVDLQRFGASSRYREAARYEEEARRSHEDASRPRSQLHSSVAAHASNPSSTARRNLCSSRRISERPHAGRTRPLLIHRSVSATVEMSFHCGEISRHSVTGSHAAGVGSGKIDFSSPSMVGNDEY